MGNQVAVVADAELAATAAEVDGGHELTGRPLRYLLVTVLAAADRALTVQELVLRCEAVGVVFVGRPSKAVSDALRWELQAGRVKRLGRGIYVLDSVPRSTMRWIQHRTAQTLAVLAGHAETGSRENWRPPWPDPRLTRRPPHSG